MKLIESISSYIASLNCMSTFESAINTNYLAGEIGSFSIEEVPCEPILKKYLDGSSKRQFQFVFCSREPYGAEVVQNIESSGFYEDFSNEIENKSDQGILPIEIDNVESLSIKVISSAYVVAANQGVTEDAAMYQINLVFKYLKKRG